MQQGLQDKGYEEWAGEMIGMREVLKRFANISRSDIVGARAPFLKPGRNTQFKVRAGSYCELANEYFQFHTVDHLLNFCLFYIF